VRGGCVVVWWMRGWSSCGSFMLVVCLVPVFSLLLLALSASGMFLLFRSPSGQRNSFTWWRGMHGFSLLLRALLVLEMDLLYGCPCCCSPLSPTCSERVETAVKGNLNRILSLPCSTACDCGQALDDRTGRCALQCTLGYCCQDVPHRKKCRGCRSNSRP
jgi:hypothetical protein